MLPAQPTLGFTFPPADDMEAYDRLRGLQDKLEEGDYTRRFLAEVRQVVRWYSGHNFSLVRMVAAEMMSDVGQRRVCHEWLALLKDEGWTVRASACSSLAYRGVDRCETVLEEMAICDPVHVVRKYAGCALLQVAGPSRLPFIAERCEKERVLEAKLPWLCLLVDTGFLESDTRARSQIRRFEKRPTQRHKDIAESSREFNEFVQRVWRAMFGWEPRRSEWS